MIKLPLQVITSEPRGEKSRERNADLQVPGGLLLRDMAVGQASTVEPKLWGTDAN